MPPAFEVLLLNTAIPQIQAAQSGDTYVVPRDIAFSTVANLANGTNLLPSLTFSSDTNTGIYREGADALGFTAGGGTNQMVLTTTGLGIGTNNPTQKLTVNGVVASIGPATALTASSAFFDYNSTLNLGRFAAVGNTTGTAAPIYFSQYSSNASVGRDAMIIDSSGNLGLGVTPSAYGTRGFDIAAFVGLSQNSAGAAVFAFNNFQNGAGNYLYKTTNAAARYDCGAFGSAVHAWYNAPSGTANSAVVAASTSYTVVALGTTTLAQWQASFNDASNNPLTVTPTLGQVLTSLSSPVSPIPNGGLVTQNISFTQAMTLDALGNLLVGTTSNAAITGFSGTATGQAIQGGLPVLALADSDDTTNYVTWLANSGGTTYLYSKHSSSPLILGAANAERARITSGGYFKASNGGTYVGSTNSYHELRKTEDQGDWTAFINHAGATASNQYGVRVNLDGDPNGAGNEFLYCSGGAVASSTLRTSIRSNGGIANYQANDANLSDRREKTNFAPAKSYLDTICAIPVQTFNYIDQSEDDSGLTLGVVAQDVQAVAPELVTESNWGTEDNPKMRLSIYQTDLQYALMKCIQELKSELDSVKAELAALKGA